MGPTDQVILVQHCPTWLVGWFWGHPGAKNLRQLVRGPLRGRARLHLAGRQGGAGWGRAERNGGSVKGRQGRVRQAAAVVEWVLRAA